MIRYCATIYRWCKNTQTLSLVCKKNEERKRNKTEEDSERANQEGLLTQITVTTEEGEEQYVYDVYYHDTSSSSSGTQQPDGYAPIVYAPLSPYHSSFSKSSKCRARIESFNEELTSDNEYDELDTDSDGLYFMRTSHHS